jgi:glycerophosphoryl diester phosphodiesterase
MSTSGYILDFAQKGCDRFFDLRRYSPPGGIPPQIVAHRGAWNESGRIENTLAAFREAHRLGAWAVELDVRWTKDGVPVVAHDPDLLRCHGQPDLIADMSFEELKLSAPLVCGLADVVAIPNIHFMIEIKTPLSASHVARLREVLAGLEPIRDYHLLALSPDLVRFDPCLPAKAWILVGELNLGPWVRESLTRGLGGVAGHYLGMTSSHVARLHSAGQKAGVGFIPSKNLYKREWNRGIDWVYTNTLEDLLD